jgi:hypothetical protein
MEEDNTQSTITPVKTPKSGKIVKVITYLLVAAVAAGAVYFIAQKRPSLIGLPQNGVEVQAETDALIADVGKLIALPTDEKPTVATITDVDKLKDQPFFKNAKNGDKVLIYTTANKAILYRPSENRIIEVGSVNIGSQAEVTPEASPSPTVKATPKPSLVPVVTPTPQPTATPQ